MKGSESRPPMPWGNALVEQINLLNAKRRIESVDAVRVLAVISVITIHVGPFRQMEDYAFGPFPVWLVINQSARFAVPFFFVMSGYFWGRRINDGQDMMATSMAMSTRILAIFLAWSTIYLCFDAVLKTGAILRRHNSPPGGLETARLLYWYLADRLADHRTLISEGTREHLWFLVALLWCTAISAALLAKGYKRTLIALAALLYLVGVLGKAYSQTPFGIELSINTRNGPFFGLLMFTTGYLLASRRPTIRYFHLGLIALLSGAGLHFVEIAILSSHFGTDPAQDFVFGTYLMGLGASLVALSNQNSIRCTRLAGMGQYVLGIYAAHVLFVQLLTPIAPDGSGSLYDAGGQVAMVLLVFGTSLVGSRVLACHPITRRLVA